MLMFSIDSILERHGADRRQLLAVMAVAIVHWRRADDLALQIGFRASSQKNRMYEVLGLFILFVVGNHAAHGRCAHLAHMHLFGRTRSMPMTKTTFYFVIGVLILTDIVQTRYQKKLLAKRARLAAPEAHAG